MKHSLKVSARGDREIVMTRSFDAPRTLVFDAMTKPALLKRWFGVIQGWTLDVCEVDLRVGGSYRYQWSGPDGVKMGMRGIYKEIVAPERITTTEKFDESWYPGGAVGTMVLTEKGGTTTMTNTMTYDSREARDAVLKSPMEQGAGAGFDKLEELLGARNVPRSIGAVTAGFFAVALLSLGTDQVLHMTGVYPPWGQTMSDALFALATAYRIVYTVVGGWITARLAPRAPMRHVVILGVLGLIAGTIGVIATINRRDLGPAWYPIAIAVTAFPLTWLGGRLGTRSA